MKLRAVCFPILLGLVGLTAQFGCESAPSTGGATNTFLYYVRGTAIQDPNIDSSRIVVKLQRENKDYQSANLSYGSDNLVYSNLKYGFDSIYTFSKSNTPGFAAGVSNLSIVDAPFFNETVNSTVLADSLIFTNFIPPDHEKNGSEDVQIEWFGPGNTEGYVMAATFADSVYRGFGYSEWIVGVPATSGTFPTQAFSLLPGPQIDTGLYYIYVYAVTGIPDSALTSKLLPVPLPNQFADNVSKGHLTGRFGTVHVIMHDSVRVVAGP